MNVLVGMECSGVIRSRFRDAGHNAWSCDLKPAEDGSEYHFMSDIYVAMKAKGCAWDLIILHPECTALTVAGNHVYAEGKLKWIYRVLAVDFVNHLWQVAKLCSERVALENPQGVLSTMSILGKPSQYIQPYDFGEDASKKTGLWLHNLPALKPTLRVKGRMVNGVERWSNQTDSGQNKLGPSPSRATERARTYPGIASAMVEQWGC